MMKHCYEDPKKHCRIGLEEKVLLSEFPCRFYPMKVTEEKGTYIWNSMKKVR